MVFSSEFSFRDRVIIDGDSSLVVVVTGVYVRDGGAVLTEVCWISNGDAKEARIEEWRLKKADR
jgi:hypothetical protein